MILNDHFEEFRLLNGSITTSMSDRERDQIDHRSREIEEKIAGDIFRIEQVLLTVKSDVTSVQETIGLIINHSRIADLVDELDQQREVLRDISVRINSLMMEA